VKSAIPEGCNSSSRSYLEGMHVPNIGELDLPRQPDRVRRIFRHWSLVYDRPFFQLGFFSHVHRAMLRSMPRHPPEATLDVGSGTGLLLQKLRGRWPATKLVGLDLSFEMLGQGQRNIEPQDDIDMLQGSVYELPFADGTFDLITNAISSHWYLELDSALGEIARVAKPGARLLMASLHNGPLALVPGPWREEIALWTASYRSIRAQTEALEDHGFSIVAADRLLPWPAVLIEAQRRGA
jgi:ubiquinone/menaquinone biosynthesis C-methylase UbiE